MHNGILLVIVYSPLSGIFVSINVLLLYTTITYLSICNYTKYNFSFIKFINRVNFCNFQILQVYIYIIKVLNYKIFIFILTTSLFFDILILYLDNMLSKILSGCGSVGRAGGLGPSGRTFESCHSDQFRYS